MRSIISYINKIFPSMKKDLYISGMGYTVDRFVFLTVLITLVFTSVFLVPIWFILKLILPPERLVLNLIIICIVLLVSIFIVVLNLPRINVVMLGKKIEGEVAVTGRRLLLQIESGKSLANSMIDLAKCKKKSSRALQNVAYELYMGKPLEKAINEAINDSPSKTFRGIYVQIKNSLRTGTDLKQALKATLEEITRNKKIEFETFGKRLNTLGLFYMIFGTIAPSLGIVVFALLLTIVGVPIRLMVLSVYLALLLLIQVFFIIIFNKMRPQLEL